MAFLFGGHPTFRAFVEWAISQGCTTETAVRQTSAGRAFNSFEMRSPGGGRVAIVDPDMDEVLAPSEVAYYQRRLGIKGTFASTPEPSKDE